MYRSMGRNGNMWNIELSKCICICQLLIYHAFVLVEFDEHAAAAKLLAKIKSDKEIYDAIRASELVQEMEDKVEAYRQRYK